MLIITTRTSAPFVWHWTPWNTWTSDVSRAARYETDALATKALRKARKVTPQHARAAMTIEEDMTPSARRAPPLPAAVGA